MHHSVTLLPGNGIGPEVVKATVTVLDALKPFGTVIDFEVFPHIANEAGTVSSDVLASIKRNKVGLKGPTSTPKGKNHRSYNVQLREELDLFVNLRPICSVDGVKTRYTGTPIDLIIFRENLEDLYVGEERAIKGGFEAIARITEDECYRVSEFAFEYARKHGRQKVTVIHKANILPEIYGLFLRVAQDVARRYDEIACDDLIVDNGSMQLGMNPDHYDCLLAPNLFGDIYSDMCAGFVGGLGFAPGANIGYEYAVFEAVHGTGPTIAGKDIANPSSLILSAALMLEHLGEVDAAKKVSDSLYAVVREGKYVTADVRLTNKDSSPAVGTQAFAEAIVARM